MLLYYIVKGKKDLRGHSTNCYSNYPLISIIRARTGGNIWKTRNFHFIVLTFSFTRACIYFRTWKIKFKLKQYGMKTSLPFRGLLIGVMFSAHSGKWTYGNKLTAALSKKLSRSTIWTVWIEPCKGWSKGQIPLPPVFAQPQSQESFLHFLMVVGARNQKKKNS